MVYFEYAGKFKINYINVSCFAKPPNSPITGQNWFTKICGSFCSGGNKGIHWHIFADVTIFGKHETNKRKKVFFVSKKDRHIHNKNDAQFGLERAKNTSHIKLITIYGFYGFQGHILHGRIKLRHIRKNQSRVKRGVIIFGYTERLYNHFLLKWFLNVVTVFEHSKIKYCLKSAYIRLWKALEDNLYKTHSTRLALGFLQLEEIEGSPIR